MLPLLHYLLPLLDIRVVLVFLCVFFVTLAYVKSCRPAGFPPGPSTFPFIGNVNLLVSNKHLHKTFFELGRKYGPIFSVQLGWYPAVVINDYDLLKEALVKKGNQCSDRFTHHLLGKMVSPEPRGVIMSEGEIWKSSKKLCTSALRDFGVGKETIEYKVFEEAENILLEIGKHKGKSFSFDLLFRKASSNVVCAMLFGKRYSYDDDDVIDILRTMEIFMEIGNVFNSPSIMIPYLLPVLFLKSNSRMKMIRKIQNVMKKHIKEHRQNFDPDNIKDFIDVFLEGERQDKTNIVFSEENCTRIILQLFMAGTDTTSGTLSWAMLFMLRHPEVQERCRREILDVIGCKRKPSMRDKEDMPYIQATLFEVLRLALVAPHAVSHSTAGEVILNGYTLPNDTVIIPDLYSIHMNPDLWEDPEEFRPERFIDTDGKIKKPPYFIPFSIGRRACLGEQLARTELFLFFTSMLQTFMFTCEDAEKLPTIHDGCLGLTFVPAPYKIIAHAI